MLDHAFNTFFQRGPELDRRCESLAYIIRDLRRHFGATVLRILVHRSPLKSTQLYAKSNFRSSGQ